MDLHQLLADRFGFTAFRPGQEAVVTTLLAGRSALAIFPTGGGKSLCYQLPALQMEGLTLVVSPLIALMKDQVDALQARGLAAERLDSSVSSEEVRDIYERMADGSLKLLYVAPERLGNEGFRSRLRRTRLAMLAIDEAHCISEWGHNFRPDYLKIAAFAKELGVPRVLALTATATPSVASDIRRAFDIAEGDHVQTGFYRPNLYLQVHRVSAGERLERLTERVLALEGPSIVYVTLQKTAESVASHLKRLGVSAEPYHAGLKSEERSAVQDRFMRDQTRVVVATIAFGMGIDKSDIRAVLHFNLPKSLESYSQEIGRAGRDGAPSRCELFACGDDQAVLDAFSYGDTPSEGSLRSLVTELFGAGEVFSVSRYHLSQDHDIRPLVVATVLTQLELSGRLRATGPFYAGYKLAFEQPEEEVIGRFDPDRQRFIRAVFAAGKRGRTWLSLDLDAIAERLQEPRERLVAMIGYLERLGCIRTVPSQLRHGYRREGPVDGEQVVQDLVRLFHDREAKDLERTAKTVAFAEQGTCLTSSLVGYFGERREPCGHCSVCAGDEGGPLPRSTPSAWTEQEEAVVREVRAEGHAALAEPRQLARFLCGLRSPKTGGRNGLQRDRRFGALEHRPFPEVLERSRSR